MIGSAVRVAVVGVWLILLGQHGGGWGGVSSAGLVPALSAHRGLSLNYALMATTPTRSRIIGGCTWVCQDADPGLATLTTLHLDDPRVIPGWAALASLIDAGADGPRASPKRPERLLLTLRQQWSSSGALSDLAATAQYAGVTIAAQATVRMDALTLTWSGPGLSGNRRFPSVNGARALVLNGVLPRGLAMEHQASLPMLGIDVASWTPRINDTRLLAIGEEELMTALGPRVLIRIDQQVGERTEASLWCDDSGLIYRQQWEGTGLSLELMRVSRTAPGTR